MVLQLHIRLKRVYETPSDDDGMRILVERLWPRGLTKAAAAIDLWTKDVAPTGNLRKWYGHQPSRWQEFRRRYLLELAANDEATEALRTACAAQPATFLFAARDLELNSAVVLKSFLLAETD